MNKYQVPLALLSSILAISVFMPLIKVPFLGEINYFMNGKGDGKYVLACALLALILSFTNYKRYVFIPGLIALLIVGIFYINYQDAYESKIGGINTDEMGSFRELGEAMKKSVSLNYGFIVLLLSSLGLTFLPIWLTDKEKATNENNQS